jgi:hypothetical protein
MSDERREDFNRFWRQCDYFSVPQQAAPQRIEAVRPELIPCRAQCQHGVLDSRKIDLLLKTSLPAAV